MVRFLRHRVGSRLRDDGGANLVEAAIALPLLLLLTFGIVEFSSFFYVWLALENGVSQATRFGITGNQRDDPGGSGSKMSRENSIIAAMQDATPTIPIDASMFTFAHLSPGGGSWAGGPGGPNDIEKVTVSYTWNFMTPIIRPFFPGGAVQIRVQSTMKNEGRFE